MILRLRLLTLVAIRSFTRFVQEALDAAASLAHFAERGQTVPEFDIESIRELLVKPYRLVYKLTDAHISSSRSFTAPGGCGESDGRSPLTRSVVKR